VSVVTYPAYQATQINARTLEEKQKELDGDGAKPSTLDLRLKELQLREKE
jgi:phage head maturation protease